MLVYICTCACQCVYVYSCKTKLNGKLRTNRPTTLVLVRCVPKSIKRYRTAYYATVSNTETREMYKIRDREILMEVCSHRYSGR